MASPVEMDVNARGSRISVKDGRYSGAASPVKPKHHKQSSLGSSRDQFNISKEVRNSASPTGQALRNQQSSTELSGLKLEGGLDVVGVLSRMKQSGL